MMSRRVECIDLGVMSYAKAWDYQQRLFDELLASKRDKAPHSAGTILVVEHPAVYTLGKSGKESNILISEEQIKALGADYYHIDRGGDVTFHGRGQIVCYPILDLDEVGISLKGYIEALEQAAIDTAAEYGIEAGRLAGASGVWVDCPAQKRKICAIGVKSSRYVTMHGMAFNVNTDLSYFESINPCGFRDKGVASLKSLLDRDVSMDEAKGRLLRNLMRALGLSH